MGHLDGRIEQDKNPAPEVAGAVKDGLTGMTAKKAPSKDDVKDRSPEKAPDVLHDGDRKTGTAPGRDL
jgi:hypothetical protein